LLTLVGFSGLGARKAYRFCWHRTDLPLIGCLQARLLILDQASERQGQDTHAALIRQLIKLQLGCAYSINRSGVCRFWRRDSIHRLNRQLSQRRTRSADYEVKRCS